MDQASPAVYISYSHKDTDWFERVMLWLSPLAQAREIRIFSDRVMEAGDKWDEVLRSALNEAALGIVLLSRDWLESPFGPRELETLSSRAVIPILIHECEWKSSKAAEFQVLSVGGQALEAVTHARQDEALRILVRSVRKQLNIAGGWEFSPEVLEILKLARGFSFSSPDPECDEKCLLYGFLERGSASEVQNTATFLWSSISDRGRERRYRERYADRRSMAAQRGPSLPAGSAVFSSTLQTILNQAAALSAQTVAGGTIHARHLLAALLPYVESTFLEFGLNVTEFAKIFLEFILPRIPGEESATWAAILRVNAGPPGASASNALAGNAPAAPPQPPVPGRQPGTFTAAYQSEYWKGEDLIGIRRDVNALAALAAGWGVEPPLSIGLFGEWGSGKSFFMRQMRDRVRDLSLAAQKSGKPQRECAWYKNIVQIEFNAWHYMEGDLWACLVEHILSNLHLPQDEGKEEVEARRKEILKKIGATEELASRAKQRCETIDKQIGELAAKAETAERHRDFKAELLEGEKHALWPRLRELLTDEGKKALDAPEMAELRNSAAELQRFVRDSQTLWGRILLQWELFRREPVRLKILLWTGVGVAATWVVARLAPLMLPSIKAGVSTALQMLLPLAAALVAWAAKLKPLFKKAGDIVSVFQSRNEEISKAVAKAETEQAKCVAVLKSELAAASQTLEAARSEEQKYRESVAALKIDLENTDANLLLDQYIQSRASAEDYRKHLGVTALIRRDFENISGLFREQRKAELDGSERPDANTVNRIVLYIDDLDRCPPESVVKVLQAIHLLLAFPLFVVVVAVDSRWVSRSLERCYDWLVPDLVSRSGSTGSGQPVDGATAHDYLEKIFQIPFWLNPMDGDACKSLIRGLTASARTEEKLIASFMHKPAPAAAAQQPAPAAMTSGTMTSGTMTDPPSVTKPVEPVSDVKPAKLVPAPPNTAPPPVQASEIQAAAKLKDPIDLNPNQLDIEDEELKKIDEVAGLLGRSPRSAKRFLNCYRLLKARMRDDNELKSFLNGPYRDVIDVLAIMIGAPAVAREVLEAITVKPKWDGAALIKGFKTEAWGMQYPAELAAVEHLIGTADRLRLDGMRSAIPSVSRFSFRAQSAKEAPEKATSAGAG